jgi:acetyl esterase/lipase
MATAAGTTVSYDPNAHYEVRSRDVEYRREGDRAFMARIYQPQGPGPFAAMIAVHGGAWAGQEWLQNEPSHQRLAEGGLVVAAIQFRTSVDAPHPAAQLDINYATRWLKAHASEFNASPEQVGGVGWSSGGHQIMMAGMLHKEYATIPLPAAPGVDGSLAYVIMGWPVIDPPGRYELGRSRGNEDLMRRHMAYFGDEAGQKAASPPDMLERGVAIATPPALLLKGAADDAVPQMDAERFTQLYSLAGGEIELAKYPGEPHGFMRQGGLYADKAFALAKSFIARQLSV